MVTNKFISASGKRIIFLDYDGTLTSNHKLADYAKPSPNVVSLLNSLCQHPNTLVYILSGRSRVHLEKWFASCDVGLVAEHGCFYKHPKGITESLAMTLISSSASSSESLAASDLSHQDIPIGSGTHRHMNNEWIVLVDHVDSTWRDTIRPLFHHYMERTPGSFIEEKEINLTWNYSNADPEFGSWQASELQVNLEKILSHMAVSIIMGNKMLELRPSSVDKSTAVRSILKDLNIGNLCDFILCIGDGKTDEVVFQYMEEIQGSITCTVGKKQTEAHYYVESVRDVESVIKELSLT